MVLVKKILLLVGIFIYIAMAILVKIILLIFKPSLRLRAISCWTRVFNRFLRVIFKIRVIIEGERSYLNETGNFIVSNHLSYLDGIVLGSLFALIYVSKSEVKKWPLLGWMVSVAETIFIDRKRKYKSFDYIQETTQMLKRRLNALVFPEGTSTNGERLYPFQSLHFQAPLNAKCSVLPVVITYTKINKEVVNLKNRDKLCWYGQEKFYQHLCQVLELKNIETKVKIHPKIDLANLSNSDYSRKDLSEWLYKIILPDYPLFK